MKKELDEALCRDFPLLFSDRRKDPKTTCMYWGFYCGDGWEPIIREAASKLEPLIEQWVKDHINDEDFEDWQPRASQIKEKFGTLRFYLSSGTDEMFEIVEKAEEKSETICEVCGKPGKLSGPGWYKTVCEEHLYGRMYTDSKEYEKYMEDRWNK